LHGWESIGEARAPYGTAFTTTATVPRLTADVEGTALFVALAILTADPSPPSPPVVEVPDGDRILVHWRDGRHTRIAFDPLVVNHS
jgi:hypothetical protein